MVVGFNSHHIDIPFHSDEEFSSNKNLVADEYFAFEPEDSGGRDLDSNFSVADPIPLASSRKGFKLGSGRKYRKQFFGRLQ